MGVTNFLFFQIGIVVCWDFANLASGEGRRLPQLSQPDPTPSPPYLKQTTYPQALVDSVDNSRKSLILLMFISTLTDC